MIISFATIEPPEPAELPPRCEVILARGPFETTEEIALMRERDVNVVVTKNSGGPLTYAKIEAARALALDVIMIAPPLRSDVLRLADLDAAMAFLGASDAP